MCTKSGDFCGGAETGCLAPAGAAPQPGAKPAIRAPAAPAPGVRAAAARDAERDAAPGRTRAGVLYGAAAYGLWGLFPLYFKAVKQVPALEIVAHRILWSLVLLAGLVLWRRGTAPVRELLRTPRTLLVLAVTTVLIAGNWLAFVWAVANGYVLQSSLGYFINPLLNVLLGAIFLRERVRGWQLFGVFLAAIGVGYFTISAGHFPRLALFLAATFGCYGLLRKIARVDALIGLTVETALLAPIALGYLLWLGAHGRSAFGLQSLRMDLLLMLAGLITATPLLWFTEAARRLRLTTMGFLQYLSPTGHFLLAVFAFGEPFTRREVVAFACIWTALVLYSVDAARRHVAEALPPSLE